MQTSMVTNMKIYKFILMLLLAFSTKAELTNSMLWNYYSPALKKVEAGEYNLALKDINNIINNNKNQFDKNIFKNISFGFLVNLLKCKILLNCIPPKPIQAYSSLIEANSWLIRSDKKKSCSNAWAELFYKTGKACQLIGRYEDANSYFNQATNYCVSKNELYCKTIFSIIENDFKRGWIDIAYVRVTNYWKQISLPDKNSSILFARILFCKNEDKKAYDILLNCLAKYGLTTINPEKDMLTYTIINNLGRATDEQVAIFYVLLGMEIQSLQLINTNEKLVSFIINERKLLSECYPHLSNENDIMKLKKRVIKK